MSRRALNIFCFILILLPSAIFAWRARDMPEFAYLHDDGLLFVSAKSLATTGSYDISSLPGNPAQTKYPPLFPLYISTVWRINPSFPDNLALATLFCWILLPICLALCLVLYRSDGIPPLKTWILTSLLGLSPYMILFGSRLFSEMFFTCFVLAALLLARRQTRNALLLAGIAAACAYLARTAGIALLVAIPAVLVWRKQWRLIAWFVLPFLPVVIGWTLWTVTHRVHTTDYTDLYYTDYLGGWLMNVGWDNLAVVVWKNTDEVLYGMGSLALPKIFSFLPIKILSEMIGVAMIAGVVRMVRKGIAVDYALFALVSVGILLIWHYPSNERFVLPVFPLLLVGLATELERLWGMLKSAMHHKDVSQRIVAAGFGAAAGVVVLAALGLQVYMTAIYLKDTSDQSRPKLADRRAAYSWMRANLPSSDALLSFDDPSLYLYSGHHSTSLLLQPRWWYAEDHASEINAYRDLAAVCRLRHLSHLYLTDTDFSRDAGDEIRQEVQKLVQANAGLKPIFHHGIGTIYEVQPETP